MIIKFIGVAAAYLLLCTLVAWLGKSRKWGYWGYLWSAVLFTPAVGLLLILASDEQETTPDRQETGATQ